MNYIPQSYNWRHFRICVSTRYSIYQIQTSSSCDKKIILWAYLWNFKTVILFNICCYNFMEI